MSESHDSNPFSIVFFAQGRFRSSPSGLMPPAVMDALRSHPSGGEQFDQMLSDAGFIVVENYGTSGESLDVWRKNNTWYVEHWDSDGVIDFRVVVFGLIDYVLFQSSWIAPMASKIMSEDLYCQWRMNVLGSGVEDHTDSDKMVN